MSSNDKDPTDSLDSLFADALMAVEKTKEQPQHIETQESTFTEELDFEFEVDIEDDFEEKPSRL